jgi:DNA ligase (NAD+)
MDIQGMGEVIVNMLVDRKIVSSLDELYTLEKKTLVELERVGEKSARNILASIEQSKNREFGRVLYALGIPNVGITASHMLVDRFESMASLMNAAVEELAEIPGIGEVIAKSINKYFNNKKNLRMIRQLERYGVRFTRNRHRTGPEKRSLHNKTFVFTGELDMMTRDEAQEQVRIHGGHPVSTVSSKTDYVVVGRNPGSKHAKAKKLGVTIIDETQFNKLLRGG